MVRVHFAGKALHAGAIRDVRDVHGYLAPERAHAVRDVGEPALVHIHERERAAAPRELERALGRPMPLAAPVATATRP